VNNVELGKKGRWRSNVWTYPGASSLGSDGRRGLQDHPTVKPTAMLKDALLDLTNRGDFVLDPFLGLWFDSHRRREHRSHLSSIPSMSTWSFVAIRLPAARPRFSSRRERLLSHWRCDEQVQQRRSRAGSRGAPSAVSALGSGGAVTARVRLLRGGQRFESPQLHHEVRASRRDFLRHGIARRQGHAGPDIIYEGEILDLLVQ
jgi:hypothetical protein